MLKYVKFYIMGSIVIAVGQIIDGGVMLINGFTGFGVIFSQIELLWAPLSVVALWKLHKAKLPKFIPVVFIMYSVAGWIFGIVLIVQNQHHPLMAINSIPKWYLIFSVCFGFYFLNSCLKFYKQRILLSGAKTPPASNG